jgi:hypothetical protein
MTKISDSPIYNTIPAVSYKSEWLGSTGYLDGVKVSDDIFQTAPVVKFTDAYDRPAIAIKYEVACPNGVSDGEYAVVAFQRYTNSDTWVYGGHNAHNDITPSGELNHTWLENLISTGKESALSHISFDASESIVCNVTLAGETSEF